MTKERVTITLPREIVRDIDRQERNRSRFILEAVRGELERRRREALRISLENPHPESLEFADLGLAEWIADVPAADRDLLDPREGRKVRWRPDEGWVEVPE
ncbi:MAG TPA: hypothetical protein VM737_08275 [Gemmatimonadota bacterium]|nr:hypothetical protein [Gemmatimonadota bacterium]